MIPEDASDKLREIIMDTWPQIYKYGYDNTMDRDHFPTPELSKEEIKFLQELLNQERADSFNYYEDLKILGQEEESEIIHNQYLMIKNLRNKFYHMTGRDTLAPGNHEQRWWDQRHDY